MSVHGTARSRLQRGSPLGQHPLVAGLRGTVGEAAQGEPAHLDLGFGNAPYRVQPHPPARDGDRMQHAVDLDELDQVAVAQLVEERVEVDGFCLLGMAGAGPAGARLHRGLEAALLPLERGPAGRGRVARVQEPGHVAERRQLGRQLRVARGCRAPGGQGGRPPPLAPQQEPAGVAAPERIALGKRGELGAVRGAVCPQLGGTERALVLTERVEPVGARGEGGPAVAARVGLQRPGEPGHAAGQRRLAAACPRGPVEVLVCFGRAPPAERDAAGQQLRPHGVGAPGRLEARGDPPGVPEQGGRPLSGRVTGLGEDQVRACLPDSPALCLEQPARLMRPLSRVVQVARGQGGGGGSEEQIRPLVRDPCVRRYPAQRGIGLLRCFSRQPCG
jgi:hypothetical protein